jgi:hypothetical protein
MYVSDDDAAVIYARACRSWYGKRALPTRYAVMIEDNAILDVRPAVVIDGCYNETYEPTGAP